MVRGMDSPSQGVSWDRFAIGFETSDLFGRRLLMLREELM